MTYDPDTDGSFPESFKTFVFVPVYWQTNAAWFIICPPVCPISVKALLIPLRNNSSFLNLCGGYVLGEDGIKDIFIDDSVGYMEEQ